MSKYKLASKSFAELSITDPKVKLWDVVSHSDIALYGGLTALISFDRKAIQKLLFHSQFKQFLELNPDIRELLVAFNEANYAFALELLDKLKVRITI